MIEITELQLIPIKAVNGLVFFASFVINNDFYVGNVAIFTKRDGSGFRCVYPTKKIKNGQQINSFYPINYEVGQQIEEAVTQKAFELLLPKEGELM